MTFKFEFCVFFSEMAQAEAVMVRRSYLVPPEIMKTFSGRYADNLVRVDREWTETFYDTKSSSLSNAECILMRESTSPKYWKFFCFARDNIMEITTDEKEIREPLSRLLNFSSPDHITNDLLQPFFAIKNSTRNFMINGCQLKLVQTDYGFAYCTIERYCLQNEKLPNVIEEISNVATKLGEYKIQSVCCISYPGS